MPILNIQIRDFSHSRSFIRDNKMTGIRQTNSDVTFFKMPMPGL